MRSAAPLEYAEVQEAIDGRPNDKCGPLMTVIKPLDAAYAAAARARELRQPLTSTCPNARSSWTTRARSPPSPFRERLDAARLIEESGDPANVAAAEELIARRQPLVFRA